MQGTIVYKTNANSDALTDSCRKLLCIAAYVTLLRRTRLADILLSL
jgi:hypothetical protein